MEKARTANAVSEAERTEERLEREADTAKKFALESFVKELLAFCRQTLGRAIAANGDEKTALSEGVGADLKIITDHYFSAKLRCGGD